METALKTAQIAQLNDALRQTFQGGKVVITQGVQAFEEDERKTIFQAVQTFSNFPEGDDPYGEHDFGAFIHNGQKLFWKIDYYDEVMEHLSEDPADPILTNRVLTILLASEY